MDEAGHLGNTPYPQIRYACFSFDLLSHKTHAEVAPVGCRICDGSVHRSTIDHYLWRIQQRESAQGRCARTHALGYVQLDPDRSEVNPSPACQQLHSSVFVICVPGQDQQETAPTTWRWTAVKQSGFRPSPRCGCSVVTTVGNRAIVFGGVYDHQEADEEDEADICGMFFNEVFSLEVGQARWHELCIQDRSTEKRRRRRKPKSEGRQTEEDGEETDEEMMEEVERSLSLQQPQQQEAGLVTQAPPQGSEGPSPRMNPAMTIRNGVLFLYGGTIEEGDRQYTLDDFYALDLHKLDRWQVLLQSNLQAQEWAESEESSDEDGAQEGMESDEDEEEDEEEEDEEEDDEMDISEDAPAIDAGESSEEYFERTQDAWVAKAEQVAKQEGLKVKPKQVVKAAQRMAAEFFQLSQQ